MMVPSVAEGLIIAIHGDYACGAQLCCAPIGCPADRSNPGEGSLHPPISQNKKSPA